MSEMVGVLTFLVVLIFIVKLYIDESKSLKQMDSK